MANSIDFKVEGVEKAIANLKKFALVKREACKTVLKEEGFKIEADAKAACPVKTGRLRASLSTNWSGSGKNRGRTGSKAEANDGVGQPGGPDGLVVVVGTNVTYGPSVEFGHVAASKQGEGGNAGIGIGIGTVVQGRPYLTPAYLSHEGEIEKRLAAVLKEDVK